MSHRKDHAGTSPISLRLRMGDIPRAGRLIEISANAAEREALALEHGLLAVDSFHAEVQLSHWKKEGFHLKGVIRASVVQQCVVTLEPLAASIEAPLDMLLVPEGSRLDPSSGQTAGELLLDPDAPEPPETFGREGVDIGALCEEAFALALDPYPRKAGAALASGDAEEEAERRRQSPFAGLSDIRRKN